MASKVFNIIVYKLTSETGKAALEKRVAELHANLVFNKINELHCPTQQKVEIVNKIIALIENED